MITFKVAQSTHWNGKVASAWVQPPLRMTYEAGQTYKGHHERLPLFAINPRTLPLTHWGLIPGCGFDTIMVVSYDQADVTTKVPFCPPIGKESITELLHRMDRPSRLDDTAPTMCLHRLTVEKIISFKAIQKKFASATLALRYYETKFA